MKSLETKDTFQKFTGESPLEIHILNSFDESFLFQAARLLGEDATVNNLFQLVLLFDTSARTGAGAISGPDVAKAQLAQER